MEKLIVVTGGTKGIGRAVIERFAAAGVDAVTCARHAEDLDELAADFAQRFPQQQLFTQPADLSDPQQVTAFAEFVMSLNRPVDVLVNNAGFFVPGQVHNEEEGVLEATLQLNLVSVYHLTRRFVPGMKARQSGHIFNLCSTASIMAYTNGGSYCISKFALYGFSKVLREELKEEGIRVTSVLPGATLTASWAGTDLPPERFMPSEDVAEAMFSAWQLSPRSVVEEVLIRPQLGDL
ncbi:Short-chain dehydrogenase [Catalinimonas alkaloidigena]|uniref:Short-chain dehydrogenase n=1 Tax=Catalinimonas alkaloidigena TaxID=1075417 RepID=A0A1G9AYV0_9BACT|nr:SDR family oxidoreductase [Catalinimonas alkaloidigena]SDK32447.1 Short-chain dehydrogenase [Catalinimonas alkaloidigena]